MIGARDSISSARGFGFGNKAARTNAASASRYADLTHRAERPEAAQRLKGAAARIAKAGKIGIMYRNTFASTTLNGTSTQVTHITSSAAGPSRVRTKAFTCPT